MTKLLPKFLQMAVAGPSEYNDLAKTIPRELTCYDEKGKVKRLREYLQTEALTSTGFIQAEVMRTIIEGAEPMVCMRDAIPIQTMKSSSMVVSYGESGAYAPEVAEAAEIPMDHQKYTPVTITAKKYGVRPVISNEAINDGLWNMVETELKKAGRKLENTLNQVVLSAILEASGSLHDTAAANQGVKAMVNASKVVKSEGFMPDTCIAHPEATAMVLLDFIPGAWEKTDMLKSGKVGNGLLGLKFFENGVVDTSATYIWDYDTDNDIGMLVLDSMCAGLIGMREDISVERYADPIRDLQGMSVKMRFGCGVFHTKSICRVLF